MAMTEEERQLQKIKDPNKRKAEYYRYQRESAMEEGNTGELDRIYRKLGKQAPDVDTSRGDKDLLSNIALLPAGGVLGRAAAPAADATFGLAGRGFSQILEQHAPQLMSGLRALMGGGEQALGRGVQVLGSGARALESRGSKYLGDFGEEAEEIPMKRVGGSKSTSLAKNPKSKTKLPGGKKEPQKALTGGKGTAKGKAKGKAVVASSVTTNKKKQTDPKKRGKKQ